VLLSCGVFGGIFGSVFGDELRGVGREGKRCRRVQTRRALVAGQKIRDALGKFRRFYALVQRLGEQQEALLLPARSAARDMSLAGLALWGKQQSIESLLIPHVWIMKRCWYREVAGESV